MHIWSDSLSNSIASFTVTSMSYCVKMMTLTQCTYCQIYNMSLDCTKLLIEEFIMPQCRDFVKNYKWEFGQIAHACLIPVMHVLSNRMNHNQARLGHMLSVDACVMFVLGLTR